MNEPQITDTTYEAERRETERRFDAWRRTRSDDDKRALVTYAFPQIMAKARGDYDIAGDAAARLLRTEWRAERVEQWGALLMAAISSAEIDRHRRQAKLAYHEGIEYQDIGDGANGGKRRRLRTKSAGSSEDTGRARATLHRLLPRHLGPGR
jgi:hypothetical protein